ncbi:MAG: VCBS repeat-containing protein, partial [Planctomycetales bacterium]|nr:VCBS repeat-containing protein [Planctomycetales bacterium]
NWQTIDNPAADGWTIEARASLAKKALDQLGAVLFNADKDGDESIDVALTNAFAPNSQISHIVLSTSPSVYTDSQFEVARLTTDPEPELARPREALRELSDLWATCTDVRFEFKVFRASDDDGTLATQQLVAVSGRRNGQPVEQHASWTIRWDESTSQRPKIQQLTVTKLEQTTLAAPSPLFVDKTDAVLGKDSAYRDQLLYGLNYWLERNQDMRYFSPLGNPGLAIGDVNGDGLDDLYLCQEANLPNRLFLQQPDGTARDAAAEWRVDWLDGSRSALLVDLDNDGDQDLVVAVLGGLVIASNVGDHFEVQDVLSTHDDTTSLTAADFDLDGDLDLYICVDYPNDFFASTREVPVQGGAANRIYHDANNAGKNALYRNDHKDGKLHFTDVTHEVGLDENNRRYSWASCWDDFDNDGDQDLYVSNDFGRNNLYVNDGGTFHDAAAEVNGEDSASGMSATWGDADGDGWMDLYISNMFSSAGGRITFQPEFKEDADEAIRQRLQRFARGNTLLLNHAGADNAIRHFDDVSVAAGVHVGRWAWSSNFVDINNDGWQDLVVANGYITTDDTGDL